MHLHHNPRVAGNSGGRRMCAPILRRFYWPSTAADVYRLVNECDSCVKDRISLVRKASGLKLFTATVQLESVKISILGLLQTTSRGNRYLFEICDHFTKLAKIVPITTIDVFAIARVLCTHLVFVYGTPVSVLSDNGSNFYSIFCRGVCQILGINNFFTSMYHPQTNGQVQWLYRTNFSALRHHVAENQHNWDL